jgi:hypothetical protein
MKRGLLQPMAMQPMATVSVLCALAIAGLAQRGFQGGIGQRVPERGGDPFEEEAKPREGEFHFIRMEYTDLPQHHRGFGFSSRMGQGSGWWIVDWPAADNHFTSGLQRLTRLDVGDPRHLSLTDPKLFDYPWIYATQTGWWGLSATEIARLREYLLRGGYLMTDDFWSTDPSQWQVFASTMAQVLPGQPITDLDLSDPVRHVHTDIGDAWEFADVPYYPEKMTALAYRYGVNYVVYAMTH